MMPRPSLAVFAFLALALFSAAGSAETPEQREVCQPFVIDVSAGRPLLRLCTRLVEAQRRGDLTSDEIRAAELMGNYLAVLARLELRLVPEAGGYRLRGARRTSETTRYLIADHLGLFALADRIAPAA